VTETGGIPPAHYATGRYFQRKDHFWPDSRRDVAAWLSSVRCPPVTDSPFEPACSLFVPLFPSLHGTTISMFHAKNWFHCPRKMTLTHSLRQWISLFGCALVLRWAGLNHNAACHVNFCCCHLSIKLQAHGLHPLQGRFAYCNVQLAFQLILVCTCVGRVHRRSARAAGSGEARSSLRSNRLFVSLSS
jgi:hypothetical protein